MAEQNPYSSQDQETAAADAANHTDPQLSSFGLPLTEADRLSLTVREITAGDLAVDSIQVPHKPKQDGVVIVRGRLLRPSDQVFSRWQAEFYQRGYTPLLRHADDGAPGEIKLQIYAGVAPKARPRAWINGLLFVLTLISTLFVGALYGDAAAQVQSAGDLLRPAFLLSGWPFAGTLLGILGAHEFGHYFAARYHKVAVTLPYFIPMPLGFGTLGAFIQLKEPVPDRRKLFDIGVAGPLAGLVLAVPLLFVGLSTSPMLIPPPMPGAILEGNSILYHTAKIMVFGKALPDPVTGEDVLMNQVTFAAWIGLLVTALNLLPVGQLDGGHTVFALFGRRARYINQIAILLMALLAVASLPPIQTMAPWLAAVGFSGWFVWLLLILLVIGPFHPPALDDVTELDGRRRLVGYLVILIFVLTFVPVPWRYL